MHKSNMKPPAARPKAARNGIGGAGVIIIIIVLMAGILCVFGLLYYGYKSDSQYKSQIPSCALPTLALGLRTFHARTGRFPNDFHEMNKAIWKNRFADSIEDNGLTLQMAAYHYVYRLHRVDDAKVAIWATPFGARATEAATHFWYLTPNEVETWMGPALSQQHLFALSTIPSEMQLRTLLMTRQTSVPKSLSVSSSRRKSPFSFLPF